MHLDPALSFSEQQPANRDPPQTTVMEEMEKSSGFREQEGGKEQQTPGAKVRWFACVGSQEIFQKATQSISLSQTRIC